MQPAARGKPPGCITATMLRPIERRTAIISTTMLRVNGRNISLLAETKRVTFWTLCLIQIVIEKLNQSLDVRLQIFSLVYFFIMRRVTLKLIYLYFYQACLL
jgi:hypothetical protein